MKILAITTRGLKNLKKNITFNFSNIVKENGIKNLKTIKGIYGNNGSGKSAFISSVDLYKKILMDKKYLFSDANQRCLAKLINNSIHEFYFEIIFVHDPKDKIVFKHCILLKRNEIDDSYYLKEEFFGYTKGRTIDENYSPIVIFVDNEYKASKEEKPTFDLILSEMKNLIGGGSFIASYINALPHILGLYTKNSKKQEKIAFGYSFELFLLSISTLCFLLDDDVNELPTLNEKQKKLIAELIKENSDFEKSDVTKIAEIARDDKLIDVVFRSNIKDYEHNLTLLTNFIQIFKPELKKIDFEKKQVEDFYYCRKQFFYGKEPIDIEYESSGVKHLVKLHSYLQSFLRGGIVFVDEMDVNINSVYLQRLLEFLLHYGKGQLCFTSHNLELMKVLDFKNSSLSVIGYDNEVDTWVKPGNRTPYSYYIHGYFDHSPFNIEPFEFLNAFDVLIDNNRDNFGAD